MGKGDTEGESGVRRAAGTHRANVHPILVLLLLGAVGLSPVEYRGGAERPHVHVVFQLWDDAADGALDHHAAEDGTPGSGAIRPVGAEAPPDIPRLTASASVERVDPLLAVAAATTLLCAGSVRGRVTWPPAASLSGCPFVPEPPPPRGIVAFA